MKNELILGWRAFVTRAYDKKIPDFTCASIIKSTLAGARL